MNDDLATEPTTDMSELEENALRHPPGFEVLKDVEGQYTLYVDPYRTYVLAFVVHRPFGRWTSYQRWVELPRSQKILIKLFPAALGYLAKSLMHDEKENSRSAQPSDGCRHSPGIASNRNRERGGFRHSDVNFMTSFFPRLTLDRWTLARLCAVCILFAIPISTAAVNILAPLMALLMLTCRRFWTTVGELRRNRVVLTALLLFLLLSISFTWDVAGFSDSVSMLSKYRKILYFPFLFLLFDSVEWRRLAVLALCASLTLVLMLSCSNWLGLTHVGPLYAPDPIRVSWVFKHHITQGLFSAFLAYMTLTLATMPRNSNLSKTLSIPIFARVICGTIAMVAVINLLVMQEGRTGPAVLPPLLMLWSWQVFLREQRSAISKAILVLAIALAVGALGITYVVHNKTSRMASVGSEILEYEKHGASTSAGLRLEFYRRSILLISRRPVLGSGVGSIGPLFQDLAVGRQGAQGMVSSNPHNEYFMISVQLGLVGLAVFVSLLWQLWLGGLRKAGFEGAFACGYVLMFAVACLANSLLLDFPEGHMLVFLCGILLAPSRKGGTANSCRSVSGTVAA
ncbi:O-antigen ligase [Paraburkholderia youngii]